MAGERAGASKQPGPGLPRRLHLALRALRRTPDDAQPGAAERLVLLESRARRMAEQALSESEERYRALAESSVDVTFEATSNGRLLYVSSSVERVLGLSAADLLGSSSFDLVHPEDRQRAVWEFNSLLKSGPTERSLLRLRRADEGWIWAEVVGRLYRTRDNERRVVCSVRDLSERVANEQAHLRHEEDLEREVARRTRELNEANQKLRELQARLIKSERLGAAGDVAASVAHAVNNPLAALIGTAELARDELPGKHIERILRLGYRVRDVVARTLDLYRRGNIEMSPQDPGVILADVREQLLQRATKQQVPIDLRSDAALPCLSADRALFTAALVSLAENALDAMPRGGRLSLEAHSVHHGKFVAFVVADTGPGIPAEERARVFEPFYTTRGGGTGLGLAIARGIVVGHQGRIRIEDRPGGGALIVVEIPLTKLGEARPEAPTKSGAPTLE